MSNRSRCVRPIESISGKYADPYFLSREVDLNVCLLRSQGKSNGRNWFVDFIGKTVEDAWGSQS